MKNIIFPEIDFRYLKEESLIPTEDALKDTLEMFERGKGRYVCHLLNKIEGTEEIRELIDQALSKGSLGNWLRETGQITYGEFNDLSHHMRVRIHWVNKMLADITKVKAKNV